MDDRNAAAEQSPVEAQDHRICDDDRLRAADDIAAAAGVGLVDLAEADALLTQIWGVRTERQLAATLDRLPAGWLAERRRARAAARERERARRALPGHVLRWLGLVTLLVVIWALTTPGGYFWPVWPALGTGTCLLGQVAAARHPVGGAARGAGRARSGRACATRAA